MTLKRHDLAGTVDSHISIDEFEPKTGTQSEIIVVGFSCIDYDPANDLSHFIERGVIETIDTEVSVNPNEDGKYMVYVEFERNYDFFGKFFKLIDDIENVTDKMNWTVKPYLSDHVYDLKDRDFKKFVITNKNNYKSKAEFHEILKNTKIAEDLMNVKFNVTEFFIGHHDYIIEDCGDKSILKNYKDRLTPLYESSSTLVLERTYGEFWDIMPTDNYIYFTHKTKDIALVLSK